MTSVKGDGTITEAGTKMDLTTSKINYTPTGGNTDSHKTSDKGVMVGLIVGMCLFMFVIAGVFILIYCMRIKHKKLKQNQSNIFAIRNVAYESDSLNITNNINERNANRFDYDHIKEQEYATIEPDTDEKYQSIAAPLSHNNKALFSKPRLKKNQDSAYSAINKSETENEYDELKVINNTNTQESEKDRPRIGYGKTHKNCLILENDNNRCSMPCDKTSKTNTNEYVEAGIVTNNFQHNNLQPQVNHDYLMLESEYSNVKTDEGNKTSQYMPDNYFILEKFDTALSNNQTEEFDKEGDYVDSPECDYDHLHKKKQRKSQENEHFNLYSHLGPDSENENTYDTSRSFQTGPHIDSNAYDTMSNVKAGITDA
ncbi:hypothetical protein KUTeg_015438 [Tegillarca granosa]|uniref:Uncharacterized protein n=1 Tax=Tegillarca granosa TaxID=220873 RepID=A0ABQ9EQ57_TEGGR|nr:hypothetical protein KUTeg_015438 [Tegillarca granosa]